ncbi:MAG: acetyltransferase [Cyanobacteriota bacterium]|nr:acetyltransferase [Cyanobacteriota bacterium]
MKKKLAILGAGGHAKVVADTARTLGWRDIYFFDAAFGSPEMTGRPEVIGNDTDLLSRRQDFPNVVVALGKNELRLRKIRELCSLGFLAPVLVHPRAYVAADVSLGAGTVVFAGAVIQPATTVGEGCIINSCASVDHDCALGDGVHVCPGARIAGGVVIGDFGWIGIGSSISHCLKLGESVTLGAGAALVNDAKSGLTYLGVPARASSVDDL